MSFSICHTMKYFADITELKILFSTLACALVKLNCTHMVGLEDVTHRLIQEQGRIHGYPSRVQVAGAVLEKVTRASGQEPYAQKSLKMPKK